MLDCRLCVPPRMEQLSCLGCVDHGWMNQLHTFHILCTFTALRLLCQPDRGEAPRGPPGPRCTFPAAICKPVVQSHLLVDEYLHHLGSQTPHRPQGHRQTAHRNESPHQLHEAARGVRGPEGEFSELNSKIPSIQTIKVMD